MRVDIITTLAFASLHGVFYYLSTSHLVITYKCTVLYTTSKLVRIGWRSPPQIRESAFLDVAINDNG